MPKISIIIPLYNKMHTVIKTVNSVLKQSFQDFELLIIDDGSTDNSLALAKTISDTRIHIHQQENKGVCAARNKGVKLAKSQFIAFLDADDYWNENHLENLIYLEQKHPKEVVFTAAYTVNYYKKTIDYTLKNHKNPLNFFSNSHSFSLINSSNCMFNKAVFDTIGFFNITLQGGEDTDFWIRIGLKYHVCFSNKITVIITKNSINQASNDLMNYTNCSYLFDYQKQEEIDVNLKKYMDLQRYGLVMRFRKKGEKHEKEQAILKDLNTSNLRLKQQLALHLPKKLLKLLSL